jgi:hypothetical protein
LTHNGLCGYQQPVVAIISRSAERAAMNRGVGFLPHNLREYFYLLTANHVFAGLWVVNAMVYLSPDLLKKRSHLDLAQSVSQMVSKRGLPDATFVIEDRNDFGVNL